MNRNEIKSVSVSDSALNGFLNIILEGRGNESLEKRQEIMKAIMNAKEIDDKFISNMYQLFKAVDFFYDNDTLLESLISERVYNILNYNTTIDVNNSLSDLLKKVISALGNVIKYGYAVVGIRRNESAEVNRTADLDADIKFIPNYDIDFMLLDTYDIFYYEGEFQTANLEKITAFLDEGYSFYEMYSHKKKGSVIAVLKDLIQKHYTDSNWYNGISGLIGINICKINIDEVMNDISGYDFDISDELIDKENYISDDFFNEYDGVMPLFYTRKKHGASPVLKYLAPYCCTLLLRCYY